MLIPLACKKDKIPQNKNSSTISASSTHDSFFVTLSTATTFAKRITDSVFLHDATNTTDKDIKSYIELPDSTGKTALYIFNYANDKGYVVLSADFRYMPICAYVRNGNLDTTKEVPSMLGMWYYQTVANIQAIRNKVKGSEAGIPSANQQWVSLAMDIQLPNYNEVLPIGYPDYGCEQQSYNIVVNPLLTTEWGQGCTYNDSCGTCSSGENCGYKLTGCVATAMAQVIRYWAKQDSHNYNYSSMPNTYGNSEVQRLMRDAGSAVYMVWGCSASSANDNNVKNALHYTFSLSKGTFEDYNSGDHLIIKGDIDNGWPVLLSGSTELNHFLCFKWPGDGHEWVCDGYKMEGNACFKEFWWHMNWGWDGYENDWYYESTWQADVNNSFNYNKNFLHNVHL